MTRFLAVHSSFVIRHSSFVIPAMLAKSLVEEIDRLLKLGNVSQRKIAARLRVSRGTVAAIASGRRGLYGRERTDDETAALVPQAPPERCPCCGYLVYLPCLVCRSREVHERRAALRAAACLRPSLDAPRPAVEPPGPSTAAEASDGIFDSRVSAMRLVVVPLPVCLPVTVLI